VDPKNRHSVFYVSWKLPDSSVGDLQHIGSGKNIQGEIRITYYIISLDDHGLVQLEAEKTSENFVLRLPESHRVVSNRIVVKR
jgi:hypothetical protein